MVSSRACSRAQSLPVVYSSTCLRTHQVADLLLEFVDVVNEVLHFLTAQLDASLAESLSDFATSLSTLLGSKEQTTSSAYCGTAQKCG